MPDHPHANTEPVEVHIKHPVPAFERARRLASALPRNVDAAGRLRWPTPAHVMRVAAELGLERLEAEYGSAS